MRFSCFLAIQLLLLQSATPVSVKSTVDLINELVELAKSLLEAWNIVNKSTELIVNDDIQRERLVFSKLDTLNIRIVEIEDRLNTIDENIGTITKIVNELPDKINLESNFNEIRTKLYFMNSYYKKMEKYVMDFDMYESSTLIEFGNNVVSINPNSVYQLMESVHSQITRPEFLRLLKRKYEPTPISGICMERLSQQQIFQNFLKEAILINTKSHVLMQTAYMIKKMYGQGNFTKEIQDENDEFQSRVNGLIETLKPYVATSSTSIWSCDPQKHVKGETYLEVTNFFHGFILNKANLDPRGQCRDECGSFNFLTKVTKCQENSWCKQQLSCSKILNCQYTDESLTVCKQDMVRDGRRYLFAEYENGRVLGKKSSCPSNNLYRLETYRDWLIFKCSNCLCVCEEKENAYSDRYISLRSAMTNISDNRVVTGVRFVRHNRIIHLQVQEGKLLEYGKIDLDTVRWVPVENYKITDSKIYEGQDFHVLTWEQRSVELSDIILDEGRAVTGLRFKKVGKRLHLEVLSTPFNVTTGQLKNPYLQSYFQDEPDIAFRHKFGKALKLNKPDSSISSTSPSTVFTTNKHVEFTHSDIDKDAAQTTVPFFDSQPVYSAVPAPLSGVGIFHKGLGGSGGFIAPRIFNYNLTDFLKPFVPPNALRVNNN